MATLRQMMALFRNLKISGYFIRAWDHGTGIDPDAANRWEAPDIVSQGDVIGTIQQDGINTSINCRNDGSGAQNNPDGTIFGSGATAFSSATPNATMRQDVISAFTNDTRPKNIYLMPIIKY